MTLGDLLHTMSALMETCKRHVSHATRRLRSHPGLSRLGGATAGGGRKRLGGGAAGFLVRRVSLIPFLSHRRGADEEESKAAAAEEESVWQRTILMGEKCEPLNFSGAIHYDSSGRQLSTPRTPMRTPLTSFAFHDDEVEEEEGEEAVWELQELTHIDPHL